MYNVILVVAPDTSLFLCFFMKSGMIKGAGILILIRTVQILMVLDVLCADITYAA